MTSALLQPDATMVDGVGLTELQDHSVVRDAGYVAESLYVGNRYGTNRTAIERAWAAGLPVMLNYEGIEDDAKNGYQAGKRAALDAIKEAQRLGFNGDCPLPFSAADKHFADIAGAGLDYHRAVVDVFASEVGWDGGGYGFKEMLELLPQQDWWPPTWPLWHWGGDGKVRYSWAWVKQGPGGSYFNPTIGIQVDHNTLLKPMRFWSGDGPDQLDPEDKNDTPAPLEADMPTLFVCTDAYHWPGSPTLAPGDYPPSSAIFAITDGGPPRHVAAGGEANAHVRAGAKVVEVTGPEFKGMLDAYGVYSPSSGVGGSLGGEGDRQFIIGAGADLVADLKAVPDGPITFHFERA